MMSQRDFIEEVISKLRSESSIGITWPRKEHVLILWVKNKNVTFLKTRVG